MTNPFERVYMNRAYQVRLRDEMENKLIQVSGFDTEKLIELFAAGWTLEPPKNKYKENSFRNLMRLLDIEEGDVDDL